ncbi:hypothetical protein KFE25_010350 [Diacronema lutheri]|uniref:Uncharacterized protein n=2 Tax=Diacronema lutheri TaxID=2081491 RepID=A0A8J5XGI2_DIALT|nr:hypothetical protein KFE25_010350 [Diacronema lutheri]
MTDADSATLQEALALNAQLKEMETLMSRVEASKARLGSSSAARSGIGGYGGRTFTSAQEYEIQRNNAHLINKLARVRVEANAASGGRPPVLSREGSAAINRKKKASEIERENARLVARIQGQKSTLSNMKPPPTKPKPTSGVGAGRGGTGVGMLAPGIPPGRGLYY